MPAPLLFDLPSVFFAATVFFAAAPAVFVAPAFFAALPDLFAVAPAFCVAGRPDAVAAVPSRAADSVDVDAVGFAPAEPSSSEGVLTTELSWPNAPCR